MGTLTVGARIRYWRRRNGNRSQAAIAGLCGISEDHLSQIERGRRTPALETLLSIAREIGVPVSALLDEDAPVDQPAAPRIASDVTRVLMGYCASSRSAPAAPAALRERVEHAWRTWQTSQTRYTDTARLLPELLSDVQHAVEAHRLRSEVQDRREALRAAADLYGLLRSYCRRTGRNDLSLLVADRALRAAQDADDPLRIAAAEWNLGHVLLSQSDPEGAEEVASRAIEELARTPESDDREALAGALELVVSTAAAQRRDWWRARQRLEKAALPHAARVGEGNVHWTVFGPTNVGLHALGIEMLAGETTEALRRADQVDIERLPSLERRFTFLLDVARCYDMRREDASVLVHLLDIEQFAPEDLARNPVARQIVSSLRDRVRPTYRRQVEALAERLGIDEPGPGDNPV
ncbi:helix-turn-helix domain-containing protein [Streptomyces aureoversilis]|uniref:Helix-turn-helix domain-containing protein n=1 Tax=Streptomyces aureoversilis TaxID=67277 RepID=A0ABV9ZSE3_9ACTN